MWYGVKTLYTAQEIFLISQANFFHITIKTIEHYITFPLIYAL
jgi:hypothetical protein